MTTTDSTAAESRFDALDKVRKLLATAERFARDGNDKAAEVFNNKAADMIAKYGIDAALLNAQLADDVRAGATSRKITVPAPYTTGKARLLGGIASVFKVRVIVLEQGNRVDAHAMVCDMVGFESDLVRLELLYTSLLVQSAFELARQFVPAYETAEEFRLGFFIGYTKAVKARLEAAEERARQGAGNGTSTDLVLRGRDIEVANLYAEMYPDASAWRSKSASGAGRNAGWAAGQRANLGGTAVGGSSGRSAIG